MTQKNSENIYKALKEEERTLLEKNVTWIGNSGKSVLGSFIRRLYPKESVSSIRLKNLKNQFGMASLATSVINFDMDMSSSRIDDEAASRLKQITGGDSMNAQKADPTYKAYISLILGILTWVTSPTGIIPLITIPVGVFFGVQAMKSTKKKTAIAGLVLNGIMVVAVIAIMIAGQ